MPKRKGQSNCQPVGGKEKRPFTFWETNKEKNSRAGGPRTRKEKRKKRSLGGSFGGGKKTKGRGGNDEIKGKISRKEGAKVGGKKILKKGKQLAAKKKSSPGGGGKKKILGKNSGPGSPRSKRTDLQRNERGGKKSLLVESQR